MSLSESTPMMFYKELTDLGSEAFNYTDMSMDEKVIENIQWCLSCHQIFYL